jgi:hypothetical protein
MLDNLDHGMALDESEAESTEINAVIVDRKP